MQNLLEGGLDATSWIFIIVLLVLVVLYFVSFFLRNKKDKQRREELYSGLKKGDYVMTYAGVVGRVVEIFERDGGRVVTIQTGQGGFQGYTTVLVDAIMQYSPNEADLFSTLRQPEEKKEKEKEAKELEVELEKAVKEEPKEEPKQEEKPENSEEKKDQ